MRFPRQRALLFVALYGVLSVVFCAALFEHPNRLGVNDWDQHLFYYGAVLKNVVEYGQAPFWNPWYCGGNVLWQNPQVGLLSPVYPLALVVPLQLAMKINIVLHYWAGFIGMHVLLTRVVGLTFVPAVVFLATLVTAAGAPAIHVAVGHSVFLPGFYLPAMLYFLFRAFTTGAIKDALLAAAILALMVFNGGVHILPMALASVGFFAALAAAMTRRVRPLVVTLVFVTAGLAYAAPKLLPVSLFVSDERFWDTRNPTEHPDRMTLEMVTHTYLHPDQSLRTKLDQQRHGWHEYGNYIGPASALLLVAGLFVALWGRGAPDAWLGRALALTAAFLFVLSLGEFSAWAPASLLKHLPLFSSFRIPSRYTIPSLLFGAMALGWVVRGFALDARSRVVQVVAGVLCLAIAAHLISVNRAQFKGVFSVEPFDTTFPWLGGPNDGITTDFESSAYTRTSPMLRALMSDRFFYYCYESLQLVRNSSPEKPLLFTEDEATITGTRFTPNRVDFAIVGAATPTRLYLNYNWGPGWTSTAGTVEHPPERIASVMLQPGQTGRYVFSFVPPGLWAGIGIFLAALGLSFVVWRRLLLLR